MTYAFKVKVINEQNLISFSYYLFKLNSNDNPTIISNDYSYQSVKKLPLICCVSDLIYTNETFISDPTLNENLFKATKSITLENIIIPQGSNFVFKAGTEIVLKQGTVIEAGSNVSFSLEECSVPTYTPCGTNVHYSYRKARPAESSTNPSTTLANNGTTTLVPPKTLNDLTTQTTDVPQNSVWLKLSIYNSMGQKLYELKDPGEKLNVENLKSGSEKINLPQGLYFFYFSNEKEAAVRKVVKL